MKEMRIKGMFIVSLGIFIIFKDSFTIGSNWIGDLLGLLLALFIELELTLLRKYVHFSHILIISFSGFVVPIWLWLFLNKIPPKMTLVEAVFIFVAIITNSKQKQIK